MGVKSRGRGIAATFGLLLVFAGVVGAVVLWVMADRRPEQAVERFARGPVGCTTTLEFGDAGTFFVYAEVVAPDSDAFAECDPVSTPDTDFRFDLLDEGRSVATRDDTSVTYDTPLASGTSVARVEIDEPGRYELVVEGSDASVVAAIGRDPDQGVSDLRRGAIVVGVLGVLLGALLLILAGRRSRRAATVTAPVAPPASPPSLTAPIAAPATAQTTVPTATPSPGASAPVGEWPPAPPRVPDIAAIPVPAGESASQPAPSQPAPSQPARSQPSWAPPRAEERHDPPTVV